MTWDKGQTISTRFVRDVIGEPESWPNFTQSEWQKSHDMRGATITEVFSADERLAIQTKGAACGATFSTFVVKDKELRDRLTQILRPDVGVHEAVAAAL